MIPQTPWLKPFRELTERLSLLLEQEGQLIRPYAFEAAPFFHALSIPEQKKTVNALKQYIEIAHDVLASGHSLKNTVVFTEQALKNLNLKPHPDFMNIVKTHPGVVEFYSLNNTQLFRTFNFFERSSYTIEDIYCREWVNLYERDEEIVRRLYAEIESMARAGDPLRTIEIGAHIVKERVSLEHLEAEIQGVHISPLCRNGEMVALACLIKMSL